MKVGDLVKLCVSRGASLGLIVDLVEKKCWRTDVLGNKINWGKIEPEPHAVVIIGDSQRTIPLTDLEPVDEGG